MKKILFIALLAVFSFTAFAQRSNENAVNVRLVKFERTGQTVTVEFSVEVDGRNVRTTDSWTLMPQIRAGAQSRGLPFVVINGNNERKMAARAEKFGGSSYGALMVETVRGNDFRNITYSVEVPYEEWMGNSFLLVENQLTSCTNRTVFTRNLGALNAPAPHKIVPHPAFITPGNEHVLIFEAFVAFPVNVSVIRPAFSYNSVELDKISATFEKIRNFNESVINSIALTGFASPEGPYNNNARLARERTEALKNHITRHGVASGIVNTHYVPEDWDGLRKLVEESNIEGKAEALAIIDSSAEPDAKEASLRRLNGGRTFRIILREMMPLLRRTEFRLNYDPKEDVAVKKELAISDPALLSQYELFKAANEFGLNSPEAMHIYQFIESRYGDDAVAQNNLGAFRIVRGDFAGAKRNLEKAASKGTNGATVVNLGIIEMMNGNYDAAEKMFRQGASLGNPQAEANLKELALMRQKR